MKKLCDFCKIKSNNLGKVESLRYDWIIGLQRNSDLNNHILSINHAGEAVYVKINFCPICGRELK